MVSFFCEMNSRGNVYYFQSSLFPGISPFYLLPITFLLSTLHPTDTSLTQATDK